jgi:tetrapyrrole methylase family protein/MazG family protein
MKTKKKNKRYTFDDFVKVIARLRGPGGCPWDRKQNHKSLTPYIVEETYEVLDAIERRNADDLCRELGDLLLQIMLHAQIASERKRFSIGDVIDGICTKIIGRHPHVFRKQQRLSAKKVLDNWERIKINETGRKKKESVLNGIPRTLPALLKAYRLQEKTARFGFDWENPTPVLDKIVEETNELRVSMKKSSKSELEHEMGDVFFALVNLARHLKIDPERALERTNRKFIRRFRYIEKELPKHGKTLTNATLADMDPLWDEAKAKIG